MSTVKLPTLLCALAWVLGSLLSLAAQAQPSANATARPKHKTAPVRLARAPQPPVLPALSEPQRLLAQQVEVGRFPCEFGVFVSLQTVARAPGYFQLQHGKSTHWLAPVESVTGAVRLEDARTGVVWLQLGSKSMLMNEKLGRRLVDACMSPSQVLVTLALQKNPPPFILDGLPTQTKETPPALALGERQDDK
jgi:hypothetical protein